MGGAGLMRLHSLRMRAFGPFATEQVVDFDRLGAGGLFLLDGPTGAGKTTVLDAVTFALYGPGERHGDGRLQSGFAAPDAAPEVMLEFSVRGCRHRVTRVPEHERPKRRGTGTTAAPATVHLERLEGATWVSRSSNKAEVADLLAEQIGLTRAQFTQVVLLPQGEFARFLQASDDERRALLTTLFAAGLYDRITDELDRRRVEAVRDMEADRQQVQAWLSAAAEAANLEPAERGDLARADDIDAALAEVGARLAGSGREAVAAHRQAEARAATAHAGAEAAARALETARVVARALAGLAAHRARAPEIEGLATEVAAARSAEPVRPLLAAARDARERHREAMAVMPELPDPLAETAPDDLAAAAAAAAEQAAALTALVAREEQVQGQLAELGAARAELAAAEAEAAGLLDRLAQLPGLQERARATLAESQAAETQIHELSQRRTALQASLADAQRVEELAPRVAERRSALEAAITAHQEATDAHQSLQERRLAGIAAELAGALRPGEPCPVCGGADHPLPAVPAPDAVSARDVAAAAGRRSRAEAGRDAARSAHEQAQREFAAAAARADGAEAAALETQLAQLDAQLRVAQSMAAALPERVAVATALGRELEGAGAAAAAARELRGALGARCDALTERTEALAAELRAAAGQDPTVAARQRRLREDADRLAERAAAAAAVLRARADLDAAQQRAASEAAARGFS
ncbi:MAG: SMC family ATPase, partial [Jatrophihabitans sp.]